MCNVNRKRRRRRKKGAVKQKQPYDFVAEGRARSNRENPRRASMSPTPNSTTPCIKTQEQTMIAVKRRRRRSRRYKPSGSQCAMLDGVPHLQFSIGSPENGREQEPKKQNSIGSEKKKKRERERAEGREEVGDWGFYPEKSRGREWWKQTSMTEER